MCDLYGEACFSQKIFTNWQHMALSLWAWVQKTVCGVETLSGKEKISGAIVSKEGYADSLLEHERIHHNWFPW